jgi:hypothetical protein
MIIYKTTNLINGKFYVGKDERNKPDYLGSGINLQRAIKKYGEENFIKETVEVCSTREELIEREKYWIKETKAQEIGYNIADGGWGGNTYTEETRQRISKQFTGRKHKPETIKKLKGIKKNPKLSDEERDRRRQKMLELRSNLEFMRKQEDGFINCKNMNYSPEFLAMQKSENQKGEKGPNWGKKASKETREKMSVSNKRYWLGKKQPPEAIEKRKQTLEKRKKENPEKYKRNKESIELQRAKVSGENNYFYGQTHTIEAKEKMSQSKINKTPEQKLETYIKFYISRMGYEPSEEQKQKKLQEYIKKKEK